MMAVDTIKCAVRRKRSTWYRAPEDGRSEEAAAPKTEVSTGRARHRPTAIDALQVAKLLRQCRRLRPIVRKQCQPRPRSRKRLLCSTGVSEGGTYAIFTPRQVPDTAPRAKFHFEDRQPSASRARPQPQAPLASDFQHPPKPSLAEKVDKAPLREWQALVDGDPLEVASLNEDSPFYETILQVLKSNHSVAGNLWHHRSLYVESTVEQWAMG
jgi:hypothetical protein